MYLLSGLLLTTLIAFSQTQEEPSGCQVQVGTQHSSMDCSNITNFSALTDSLPSVNLTIVYLRIAESPHLILQREDLNIPELKNLKSVFLVDSNLTSFNSECFQDTHLETLGIIRNNLVSLNASTFQGLTTVKKLLLKTNQIATIHNSAFKQFGNLTQLDLRDNKLTTIDADLFEGVALIELLLKYNFITHIEERSFHGLDKLLRIDLSFNKIKAIDSRAFQTLRNLQIILLMSNEHPSLDSRLFENTNLMYLDISLNDLEHITNFLLNSTTLQVLRLEKCNIHSIPANYFENVPNLLTLFLNKNKISHIEDNLFTPLVQLKVLDLGENNLTSLSVTSFQQFYDILNRPPATIGPEKEPLKVNEVTFDSNPWKCGTEDMTKLHAWTVEHNVAFGDVFDCKIELAG